MSHLNKDLLLAYFVFNIAQNILGFTSNIENLIFLISGNFM
jgi:hypothetical protein